MELKRNPKDTFNGLISGVSWRVTNLTDDIVSVGSAFILPHPDISCERRVTDDMQAWMTNEEARSLAAALLEAAGGEEPV